MEQRSSDTAAAPTTALGILGAISLCHCLNDLMQSVVPAVYPILKSSKNPDLAWELQKFTVSEELEKQYVGTADKPGDSIPSRRSVAATISKVGVPPANSDLFYNSIDKYPTLVPYPAPPKYSEFESTTLRNLQLIFAGETSVSDGLKKMQSELSSIVSC